MGVEPGAMELPEGVFIDGPTALELASVMRLAVSEARRNGTVLSPRLLAAARNFEAVGERWREQAQAAYLERNIGIPLESAPAKVPPMGTMGTKTAAEMLGVSRRAVVGLAQRGTLPGHKVAGVWVFALPDVADAAEARKDHHAA